VRAPAVPVLQGNKRKNGILYRAIYKTQIVYLRQDGESLEVSRSVKTSPWSVALVPSGQ
jgi:hypothetical protein